MNGIFCIIMRKFVHLNWVLVTIAYAAGTLYTSEVDFYNRISLLASHSRLLGSCKFHPSQSMG